jgi:hypothetical protein
MKVHKVTAASIGETKRGFKVFKLQLNNTLWVTKLIPLNERNQKSDPLYSQYSVKNNLEFIVGKYIAISLKQTQYGQEFSSIESFDVLSDFKTEMRYSKGSAFTSSLPIYDFLINMGRNIEPDGSIKIKSDFPDMRVSKLGWLDVCYLFDSNNRTLTPNNINTIFEQFYKDITLPSHLNPSLFFDSHYKISLTDAAIVKMHYDERISNKATTSGDWSGWIPTVIIKIGEELPDSHAQFIKENPNKTVVLNNQYLYRTGLRYNGGFYRYTVEDTYIYDKQLLSELRSLRKNIALDEDIAPFIVFNDSTLKEIAHKKPCNTIELSKIKSFNQHKIARYGQKILNLIRTHT